MTFRATPGAWSSAPASSATASSATSPGSGWTDIVLLDKGPLPNPGGSTGHASNFIFPTDHNKEMALLTLESQRQYVELGLNTTCGGIEVARDEARLEEFRRRMTSATAWGIDARLLTPAEIKELVPFVNADILLGGYYTPSVSVVDSLQTGTRDAPGGDRQGRARRCSPTPRCSTSRSSDGAIRAVVTDKGRIEAEHVVIACGVWSPRIAAMAGATIPLTPAVHQMADVGPIDILQESNARRSPTRSSATWTRSATSASRRARWRSAPTPTGRSSTTPTTSRRTRSRRCRPPSCRSPPTTSTSRWSRRST